MTVSQIKVHFHFKGTLLDFCGKSQEKRITNHRISVTNPDNDTKDKVKDIRNKGTIIYRISVPSCSGTDKSELHITAEQCDATYTLSQCVRYKLIQMNFCTKYISSTPMKPNNINSNVSYLWAVEKYKHFYEQKKNTSGGSQKHRKYK